MIKNFSDSIKICVKTRPIYCILEWVIEFSKLDNIFKIIAGRNKTRVTVGKSAFEKIVLNMKLTLVKRPIHERILMKNLTHTCHSICTLSSLTLKNIERTNLWRIMKALFMSYPSVKYTREFSFSQWKTTGKTKREMEKMEDDGVIIFSCAIPTLALWY